MHSRLVSLEDASYLLEMDGTQPLEAAVEVGIITPARIGPKGPRFLLGDILVFKLRQIISEQGVSDDKATRYAEAILRPRLEVHGLKLVEWIENESQELFVQIADKELARIFLRNKDDRKEVDVGAVRPVLFPITKCEINIFRAIRPLVYRARILLGDG